MIQAAILILVFLLVVSIAATLPYPVLRYARRNCWRLDGSFSQLRLRKELRHLVSFSAEVLMVPILAFGLSGSVLFAVNRYLIPIPLLEKAIELFDVSFAKWDENMETGKYGDIGYDYGDFGESAGYSEDTSYVLRKTLKHNWLFLTLLFIAFGVFVYWFTTRYYIYVVDQYRKGVFARQVRYSRVDEHRALSGDVREVQAIEESLGQ